MAILGLRQLTDLPSVSQEGPGPQGLMLARARRWILSDMDSMQAKLRRIGLGSNPTFSETRPPGPNGLHLRAKQLDTAFEGVPDQVIVPGSTILDDHRIRIVFSACLGHDLATLGPRRSRCKQIGKVENPICFR